MKARLIAPLLAALALVAGAPAPAAETAAVAAAPGDDPFLWLEDVQGERAMTWVKAENARTLGMLEADRRFAGLQADALRIAQAADRIPSPAFMAGAIYNFWQDSDHVRGVWRRTSLAGYGAAAPRWTTILDLDALAAIEKANWVWKGADCLRPAETRCLIQLSDGGEDAVTVREYDLTAQRFVTGGFSLPHGKQDVAWEDRDTLLAAREWAPGEMTSSGYAYVVKRLRRGQSLDQAQEVFRGSPKDVGVAAAALVDGEGHRVMIILRHTSIFEAETWLLTSAGPRRLALPTKATVRDLVAGRIIVSLEQDWTIGGRTWRQGSLISLNLAAALADPAHPRPRLVYAPGPRESVETAAGAKGALVLVVNQNVRGRAFMLRPLAGGGWSRKALALPDNVAVNLVSTDSRSRRAFLSVTGFLDPTSLWLAGDPAGLRRVKSLAPKFDASRDVVEQREATSSDGVRIPYFIVHPKTMAADGSHPTVLNAYGGFGVSRTPVYSPVMGKLWLERGGVFVVANIRGGGEFGPAWHEAGLKTRRQIIYDDFAAVARDLIDRGVTSPRRLGIMGGSNGGLLMGVEFTQHPELWRAVDIQVPLLDMVRYESIAAGASWVGEYGSMANPDEAAFLRRISPYANLRADADYPEPLIWTTTKDDRVGPQHARKFAARLGALGKPYLYYEVIEGGHGAGANLRETAHTNAVEFTYFLRRLVD